MDNLIMLLNSPSNPQVLFFYNCILCGDVVPLRMENGSYVITIIMQINL